MKWIQYSLEWRRKKYPDKKSDYISRTLGLLPLENVVDKTRQYMFCKMELGDLRMNLKWKRANKTETTNEWKWSDLVGLSNGYKRAWFLVG